MSSYPMDIVGSTVQNNLLPLEYDKWRSQSVILSSAMVYYWGSFELEKFGKWGNVAFAG